MGRNKLRAKIPQRPETHPHHRRQEIVTQLKVSSNSRKFLILFLLAFSPLPEVVEEIHLPAALLPIFAYNLYQAGPIEYMPLPEHHEADVCYTPAIKFLLAEYPVFKANEISFPS
jgi:hypothetical protein